MLEFVYELKKDLDTELYQINIDEAEILRKAESYSSSVVSKSLASPL